MAKKRRRKKPNGKTKGEATYEWLVAKGKEFAADLKSKSTKYENMLFKTLKELGYKFEFQYPIICNLKKLYIADFVLTDYNLIIEVDGVSCHSSKEDRKADNQRTKKLRGEGYAVIRLWNKQVETFTKPQIDQIIKLKIDLLKSANN